MAIEWLALAPQKAYSEESGVAFAQGDALEEEFITRLISAGLIIARQVGVFIPSHGISGRVDAIVFRPEPEILEIKTVKGYPFKKLMEAPWDAGYDAIFAYMKRNWMDKILINYTQLQLYLFALEQEKGFLIYFDKNTGKRLDLEIRRDDTAVAKALTWFSQTKGAIDKARLGLEQGRPADEVLPPTLDKKKFPCAWEADRCAFWEFCYGEKK